VKQIKYRKIYSLSNICSSSQLFYRVLDNALSPLPICPRQIVYTSKSTLYRIEPVRDRSFGLSLNPTSIVMFEGASGCGYPYHYFGPAAVKGRHEVLIAEKALLA